MTVLENGSEVNHNRKGKTPQVSHAVERGFRITITEITKGFDPKLVGKTRRTGYSNVALHIKRYAMAWADGFPRKFGPDGARRPSGFTPAVRDVFKRIVWAQDMGKGYAAFSYETLGAPTKTVPGEYDRRTVCRAVNWLRDHGLIQHKTGRGWGREDRRNLANQYTPNFWIFIDPDTGRFIDPPYHKRAYAWGQTAACYRDRLINGPQAENVTAVAKESAGSRGVRKGNGVKGHFVPTVGPENQQNSVEVKGHNVPLYDNTGGGANAAPASPNGSTAPRAPRENNSENNSGKSEKMEFFAELGALALALGTTPKEFLAAGSGDAGRELDRLCRERAFPGGRAISSPLSYDPPDAGSLVCVEVIAGEGTYREKMTGFNMGLDFMDGDSPVYITFLVPSAMREKSEQEHAAMMAAREY